MCGLFGFAGQLSRRQRATLLRTLCVLNQERGRDSVGLARITAGERPEIIKSLMLPTDVAVSESFNKIASADGHVWIGHTRAATRGAVSLDNAHPFHMGQTVLAHNGMVSIDSDMVQRCDGKEFEVDSQHLTYLINRDDKLGEIDGCAAMVFSKMKAAADVSLVRYHNPLTVAYIYNRAGLVWSSTWQAVKYALAAANIRKYEIIEDKDFPDCTRADIYLDENGRIGSTRTLECGVQSKSRWIGYQRGSTGHSTGYKGTGGYSSYAEGYDADSGYDYYQNYGRKHRKQQHQRERSYPPVCGLPEQKAAKLGLPAPDSMADTQIIDDDDGQIWLPSSASTDAERALWNKLREMEERQISESMVLEDAPEEVGVVQLQDEDIEGPFTMPHELRGSGCDI